MISITSYQFNPSGMVELDEDISKSDTRSVGRRVSRHATLDQGAVIDDAGFSDGDRTLDLRFNNVTEDQYSTLLEMMELYPDTKVSTKDGLFKGMISRMAFKKGITQITFLVSEKLSV